MPGGRSIALWGALLLSVSIVLVPRSVLTAATTQDCTVTGTVGDDRLIGTAGPDVICGLSGNDVIDGGGGDDVILGGPGGDVIVGGAGDDTIKGGAGDDDIAGSAGSDTVAAGAGDDSINGGAGADSINGAGGTDSVAGGGGDDSVSGGSGSDTLYGGQGSDELTGGAGADDLDGGPRADDLFGGKGDDELNGGSGDDTLAGGPDDDVLDGGAGADSLDGGAGTNTCAPADDPNDRLAMSCDSQGPRVVALEWVGSNEVDTLERSASLRMRAQVTDDLSGVGSDRFSCTFTTPPGTPARPFTVAFRRVSGNANDGVYEATYELARYSPQGRWPLFGCGAVDAVGNRSSVSGDDLAALGIEPFFTQVSPGDSTAPTIVSFEWTSPTSVDSSNADATLTARAEVSDDLTGPVEMQCLFKGGVGSIPLDSVSSVETDSGRVFDLTMTVRRYSAQGEWQLDSCMTLDAARNQGWFTAAELQPLNIGSFRQTGVGDVTAPQFTSIVWNSPTTFSTQSSAMTVSATIGATDDLSGPTNCNCSFTGPTGVTISSRSWQRVSGDERDGTYSLSWTFPQYSATGEWKSGPCVLVDAAGNLRTGVNPRLLGLPVFLTLV